MKQKLPMFDKEIENTKQISKINEEENIIKFNDANNKYSYSPVKNDTNTKILNTIKFKRVATIDANFELPKLTEISEKPEINKNFKQKLTWFNNKNSMISQISKKEENELDVKKKYEIQTTIKKESTVQSTLQKIEIFKKEREDKQKLEENKQKEKSFIYKKKLEKFVDSNYFIIFFMVKTLFIMFIHDIQMGFISPSYDEIIDILQTITFFFFLLEIVLTSIAKEDYLNSFFFWLDVISTISIIQDISFMFDPILDLGSR